MNCRVVTPPSQEACGKPARFLVRFRDGDSVHACEECKLYLDQLAESHNTRLGAEAL